jgi:hypothetical protein
VSLEELAEHARRLVGPASPHERADALVILARLGNELDCTRGYERRKELLLLDAEVGLELDFEPLPDSASDGRELIRSRLDRRAAKAARQHEHAMVIVRERLQRAITLHD